MVSCAGASPSDSAALKCVCPGQRRSEDVTPGVDDGDAAATPAPTGAVAADQPAIELEPRSSPMLGADEHVTGQLGLRQRVVVGEVGQHSELRRSESTSAKTVA